MVIDTESFKALISYPRGAHPRELDSCRGGYLSLGTRIAASIRHPGGMPCRSRGNRSEPGRTGIGAAPPRR